MDNYYKLITNLRRSTYAVKTGPLAPELARKVNWKVPEERNIMEL